jgi:hypothetical protein
VKGKPATVKEENGLRKMIVVGCSAHGVVL